MFWNFVVRAVQFRKRRLALAFAALAVSATLATALFSVYSDIERKMRVQFRGFGANIVIAPAGGAQTVPVSAVALAEQQGAVAAPFIYTVGRVDSEPIVVAGTDFHRAGPLTNYWRVEGARAAGPGECLVGSNVAAHFRLKLGEKLDLEGAPCIVRGIVSSGGAEDAQVILPFDTAAQLAGLHDAASLVQVRADGERLAAIQATLARQLPGTDVRMLHAVAETEANVVLKIRSTLFLLTVLILAHHHAVRQQQLQRAGAGAQQGNRNPESDRRGRAKDRGAVPLGVADSGRGFRRRGLWRGTAGGLVDRAADFSRIGGGRCGCKLWRVPAGNRGHAGDGHGRHAGRGGAHLAHPAGRDFARRIEAMAFVELENVTKAYDSGWAAPVKALDRVSLTAEAGQWIAIMGPSGSGKTTLLNILGCLDQATEGAVRIDRRGYIPR